MSHVGEARLRKLTVVPRGGFSQGCEKTKGPFQGLISHAVVCKATKKPRAKGISRTAVFPKVAKIYRARYRFVMENGVWPYVSSYPHFFYQGIVLYVVGTASRIDGLANACFRDQTDCATDNAYMTLWDLFTRA
jgi:hypothetical protein